METKEKNNLIFIRLFSDENLFQSLKKACNNHNIKTAVILSGLGQLKKFELGFFKQNGNYMPEEFEEPHELISLTGNITKLDDYEFHIHASLGNDKKNVVGGHLFKGIVNVTNEIILMKTNIKIKREIEEDTGLKGLFLK